MNVRQLIHKLETLAREHGDETQVTVDDGGFDGDLDLESVSFDSEGRQMVLQVGWPVRR